MQNEENKYWFNSSYLNGLNRLYMETLYEQYLKDPHSISNDWRIFFKQLSNITNNTINISTNHELSKNTKILKDSLQHLTNVNQNYNKQIQFLELINNFRKYGYQYANLDPLKLWTRKKEYDLNISAYNINNTKCEYNLNIDILNLNLENTKLTDVYHTLKNIYCGVIGIEYTHMINKNEISWIQKKIESNKIQSNLKIVEKKRLLYELTAAEGIEHYLGIKFPAVKRFSLEGGDVLIPMLKEIIRNSSQQNIKKIYLGMAHRGRLNVLINVLGKRPADLFNEFIDKNIEKHLGSGDVKYHQGFSSSIKIEDNLIYLELLFNPSHLEIVNPVVMGAVRACIDKSMNKSSTVLPITIHGDAAISGQGVVQETFNMSQTRAYGIGGTIRIIVNNQIGFTTSNYKDIRSTEYCTDIAKMIDIPIIHVNADYPESVMFVARLASEFRNTFKKDIIIDLVCYRRHGHNESDEPSVTQPIMYKKIRSHPTVRKIYADKLNAEGIINYNDTIKMMDVFKNKLDKGDCVIKEYINTNNNIEVNKILYTQHTNKYNINITNIEYLKKIASKISTIPGHINIHPRVSKIFLNRVDMAKGIKSFDWGGAEILSYAIILDHGINIRLSGEDTVRGTFFHRHAIIYDQENGQPYIPLKNISDTQGSFYIWDSVLSEEAALAFEYGYSNKSKNSLVIWEAQFGDFTNGAQVVIDQFISSSEQKWGQQCGLIMLLPHGYEGQGPEHSSARLERYLQLCAENNMQVCVPSTPSQIYHLLLKHAFFHIRKPLIIFSPKSLLRHPKVSSSFAELSSNKFKTIIEEIDNLEVNKVIQIIICTGKIYFDLINQRHINKQYNIAIIRIEQLYPFPMQKMQNVLLNYKYAKKIIWCQEEPQNQGAWSYCYHYLMQIISKDITLKYIGRPTSAAPAVGYISKHQMQQKKIINDALSFVEH